MNFEYTISYDESLVKVVSQGHFDYLKAYEMWKGVVTTCNKSECYRVLGESRLAAPIPTMDAYGHLELIESVGVTPDYQIAWFSTDPLVLERLKLIETVLRDRSLFNVSIFDNLPEARRWLIDSD